MIVSHKHRFVFIKTRKTAGSSIEAMLYPFLGPQDICTGSRVDGTPTLNCRPTLTGHIGHERIKALCPHHDLDTYRWFCVERNPWDKCVSQYHFLYGFGSQRDRPSFNDWIAERPDMMPCDWDRYPHAGLPDGAVFQYGDSFRDTFNRFIRNLLIFSTFPLLSDNGKEKTTMELATANPPDYTAALCGDETLYRQCRDVDIGLFDKKRTNRTTHYRDYYNQASIDAVAKQFDREIDLFGWEF